MNGYRPVVEHVLEDRDRLAVRVKALDAVPFQAIEILPDGVKAVPAAGIAKHGIEICLP